MPESAPSSSASEWMAERAQSRTPSALPSLPSEKAHAGFRSPRASRSAAARSSICSEGSLRRAARSFGRHAREIQIGNRRGRDRRGLEGDDGLDHPSAARPAMRGVRTWVAASITSQNAPEILVAIARIDRERLLGKPPRPLAATRRRGPRSRALSLVETSPHHRLKVAFERRSTREHFDHRQRKAPNVGPSSGTARSASGATARERRRSA